MRMGFTKVRLSFSIFVVELTSAQSVPQEIWEPTVTELLDTLDAPGAPKTRPIEEIWALDCVIQGDSSILNESVLGNTCASRSVWPTPRLSYEPFENSFVGRPRPRPPQLSPLLYRLSLAILGSSITNDPPPNSFPSHLPRRLPVATRHLSFPARVLHPVPPSLAQQAHRWHRT